ncbi:hypothetical protein [Vibrio harveyi]|uniref:hypothetical protein n=1 Tax=Vibrio harveyi TaxID=669 RepID=UPI003BB4B9CC
MLTDATNSVKAYLYERAVSPLLGSLIISWCVWNYKFLFLLFSSLKYSEKLRFIHVLYSSDYEVYLQGMLFPLLTSMVYIFVFPYPSQVVYRFSLHRQKILNDLKNELQENELLTLEQSKAIRSQLVDVEKQFDEQVERKDRIIEARDREIAELREQIAAFESQKKNEELLEGIRSETRSDVSDAEKRKTSGYWGDSVHAGNSEINPLEPIDRSYRFYESLDDAQKGIVRSILQALLQGQKSSEHIHSLIGGETRIEEVSFGILMDTLNLYDLVENNSSKEGNFFRISSKGKVLYMTTSIDTR